MHSINSPQDVISLISGSLIEGKITTILIYLNNQNRVLAVNKAGEKISNLTFNHHVVETALSLHAYGVILLQTRYSPSPVPWEKDLEETIELKRLLNNMHLSLIDHIIVNCTGTRCFSISEGRTYSYSSI